MDKLAENLQKLGEEDLLGVVQLIHDNKTPETYTKNDVDRQYFSLELISIRIANGLCRRRIPRRSLHSPG